MARIHIFLNHIAYSEQTPEPLGSIHLLVRSFIMRSIVRFIKQEEGATAIEYGLIASLIAVAIVGVLVTLGPALKGVFQSVQNNL